MGGLDGVTQELPTLTRSRGGGKAERGSHSNTGCNMNRLQGTVYSIQVPCTEHQVLDVCWVEPIRYNCCHLQLMERVCGIVAAKSHLEIERHFNKQARGSLPMIYILCTSKCWIEIQVKNLLQGSNQTFLGAFFLPNFNFQV